MYIIMRSVLACLIYMVSCFLINKSHMPNKRKYVLITGVIILLLWLISPLILFENTSMTFETPEDAFEYAQTDVEIVELIVEGDNTAFVIAQNDMSALTLGIVVKTSDGWKPASAFEYKCIKRGYLNSILVEVYQYKDTNEYYVFSSSGFDELYEIADNKNTEFSDVNTRNSLGEKLQHSYLGYVPSFDEEYAIAINGQDIFLRSVE